MSTPFRFLRRLSGPQCLIFALAVLIGANVSAVAQQGWQSRYFPAPGGGLLVFTIIGGNPACASYNGRDCLWGLNNNQIDFNRVHPLICGAGHRAVYGITGYEDSRHWCSVTSRSAVINVPHVPPRQQPAVINVPPRRPPEVVCMDHCN
jgi:hypothetical protein